MKLELTETKYNTCTLNCKKMDKKKKIKIVKLKSVTFNL